MSGTVSPPASSPVRDALKRIERFERAVLAFRDSSGYPVNVATGFTVDLDRQILLLDQAGFPGEEPVDGDEVTVTFSHIRPRPGEGYDQRRYVSVRGSIRRENGGAAVVPVHAAGWDEEEVPFFEYCERNVARAHAYLGGLSRERGHLVRPRLTLWWKFFLATRVPFLSATVIPVILGAVIARWQGFSAWWLVVAALLGASAIHLGLNVANDIFDTASGADDANVNPTPFSGGSRVIQYGLVGTRAMWVLSGSLFAGGIAVGLVLAAARGRTLLWIGAAGIFLAVFYTAPPFRLVYRGLGDLAVALGFGPIVTVGAFYVVAQRVTAEAVYGSVPVAILAMLILYVNQVPDRGADAAAGKKTVAVRFPEKVIVAGYDLFVVVAFSSIAIGVVLGLMPWPTLSAFGAAPLALAVRRGLRQNYDDPYGLMPAMSRNIALHALTGTALIIGYLVAAALSPGAA